MARKWSIEREKKELAEWVDANADERLHDSETGILELKPTQSSLLKRILGMSPPTDLLALSHKKSSSYRSDLGTVRKYLKNSGQYLCQRGLCRVLVAGESDGWQDLEKGLWRLHWAYLLLLYIRDVAVAGDSRVGYNLSLTAATHHFCHFLAHGHYEQARNWGQLMDQCLTRGSIGGWAERHESMVTPFEGFVLKLYTRWSGNKLSWSGYPGDLSLGVYENVLNVLDCNGDAVTAALQSACEYHTQRTGWVSESGFPEFYHLIYNRFPVEVAAIVKVRELSGLKTELPDHPLVTDLAVPPQKVEAVKDTHLEIALEYLKGKYPQFFELYPQLEGNEP